MGYIKEPVDVDFTVNPTPLTPTDKQKISEIIAYYKATGRKMPAHKSLSTAPAKKTGQKTLS